MSLLSHQSAINPSKNFWLASGTSTITVSNLQTNSISSGTIVSGVVDADIISTIQFYADIVNIDEATISSISTNAVELDGAYLTTLGGTTLLLNGVPLATASNISTLADWALDPAISTIQALNASIDVGTQLQPFRAGYFSTIYAKDAVIQSTTLTLTETVSSLYVNDLFGSTINAQTGNISTMLSQVAQISSLQATNGSFSTINATVGNFSTLNAQNVNFNVSTLSTLGLASNWYVYPAKGDVLFQPDILGNPLYSLSSVKDITCGNITAQLYGFPVPVNGGQIQGVLLKGLVGEFGSVQAGDGTFSNNTETTNVDIYGVNRPPGFNALYVNGGFTVDAGVAVHGITLGTNTAGVSLNRIDILPIGTQDYVTWGAQAFTAGLGITIDAGLGINIASGLVVDVLSQDVQLRANDTISLDADDGISLVTGGTLSINANTLAQTANNFTFNDSNFTVNSSNENIFNAQILTQGTPLPPSTIGYYSTFQQNSQIENSPLGTRLIAQSLYGLYQNISTVGWVVTSNISTIYTPSTIGLLSSYTSTITSSFERSYSTLAIVQSFPTGEVSITPSSLLLQHADKIELDTKPFPFFTTLTPGLSTIVSSLYTYEAILDGSKYSEVGEIIQTIVPVVETLSSFFLSTGVSSGTVLSTLTSSFFSTLVSQTSFTSSIYNQMYFDSNCFSTPALCISSLNGFAPLPAPYGSFTSMSSFTLGVNAELPLALDNTEYALGTYYNLTTPTEVKVDTAGLYRVLASVQFDTASNQIEIVNLYFKKNGNLVPRSNSKTSIAKDAEDIVTVEIFIDLTPSDFLEVWFASTDTLMTASAFPAGGVEPETPSIILNIQKIGV